MARTRAELGLRKSRGYRRSRRPNGERASARARAPNRRPALLPEPNPPEEPAGVAGAAGSGVTGGAWLGEPLAIAEAIEVLRLAPKRNRANRLLPRLGASIGSEARTPTARAPCTTAEEALGPPGVRVEEPAGKAAPPRVPCSTVSEVGTLTAGTFAELAAPTCGSEASVATGAGTGKLDPTGTDATGS